MYSTSAAYKTEIKKPSRSFECKITIGDRIYNNSDIVNVVIDGNIQPSDGFMIGTTVSKTLDLTLINSGDTIYSTSQVKVEIGLKIGSTIEYIPMGLFNIDDIEKTDYTTKITAFDNMIKFESAYFSSLGDSPTLAQVVNELASKTGVQFTGSLPSYTVKKLEGFTCREIVGYVASICGGNAVITRDGKFTIVTPADVSLSIDGSNYINYKREEVKYKIGKVTCKVGEEELSKGSLGTDSMELGFENPWIINNILQDIYNKLNGFNYLGYSMKWQGDLSLDVGDIITVTDVKGVVRKHPVLAQKFNYTGGLTAEIGAKGENKNKNSFSSSGDTSKKLNRVVTEVAIVNKAFVDYAHINDADIVNLKAETAKIRLVEAEVAAINTVLAGTVNAVNLNADNITAATGRIATLESGSATISQLNAANAKIATLETRAGVIDTLLAGNIDVSNLKAGLITAESGLIANGAIKDAMIQNLSVSKILAGDISTNKFRIVSTSGNMLISDNTIQIKDSTRVRVQIGKDANNDYNMYVWDSSGNLMFDAAGLKASGIKSKIIRDDMVSDTANINATKIEKESLVTRINGATTLLLASKVKLDTENQTLEVAFNSLKSTATATANTVTSQGTSISTIQGQIQAKIWQQDIDTLENNLGTRISSTETSITALNSAISLKVSTSDFNTYKTNNDSAVELKANQSALNTTNGNVNSLTTRVSTAESSISVLQNQISLKVEQSDITTAINNVQVGGRNLLKGTSSEYVTKNMSSYGTSLISPTYQPISDFNISQGDTVLFRVYIKVSTSGYRTAARLEQQLDSNNRNQFFGNYIEPGQEGYSTAVVENWRADRPNIGVMLQNGSPGNTIAYQVEYKLAKWERGTKVTDWTPAPEDQKSYTDTQISTAKAEIKLTTDSISSTVSSVQSSVTALGTRVTSTESSIISLNNSITLKVNTSDFNSYKTSNDSAVSSKASQASLNTTNGNVTALTTRVSTAESSISVLQGQIVSKVSQTEINNSINALNIGGRNLLRGTLKWEGWSKSDSSNQIDISDNTATFTTNKNTTSFIQQLNIPVVAGEQYTLSVKIKITTPIVGSGLNLYWGRMSNGSWINKSIADKSNSDYTTYLFTFVPDEANIKVCMQCTNCTAGVALVKEMKLEKGSKATDWSPAPEDTQSQIDGTVTRISTAESTITQLSNSIALKVETSTYNTKMSSLDGSISSLTSRVSAAELKITDSSIVSTVRSSTAYTSDLATKANQTALNTTNSNLSSLSTRVTNTESSITQLSNQIVLKVNQADFGTLITQNVNSVRIAVGQIGGNNLFKDGGFLLGYNVNNVDKNPSQLNYSVQNNNPNAIVPRNNNKCFQYYIANNSTDDLCVVFRQQIPVEVGKKYTIQYDISCDSTAISTGANNYIYWIDSNGNAVQYEPFGIVNPPGGFNHYSFTTTPPNGVKYMRLRFGQRYPVNTAYTWFCISSIKVEEGENETSWSSNANELNNTSVSVTEGGLTVRNGAISILNNAGVAVLKGDTNGNLSIRGDFTNYDASTGNMAIRITNRTIDFNDWDSNSICGTIFAGKLVGQTSTRGMSFGAKRNKYLDIAYEDSNGNFAAAIRLDNGALGTTGKAHVYDGGSANFTSLYVSGSKNCIQDTENYGKRLINAYETAEYYFGDLGFGKINSEGECIVFIDPIFAECVNTKQEYHAPYWVYKGKITEVDRKEDYIIFYGEPNTEFSWEIKAKRKGFEHVRLEQKFIEQYGAENIEDELKHVLSSDIEEELYVDLADELLEV
ncbi:hypothetical protein [Clostridium intestinale]|uniref:Uncharacterized protein n=1 Tax=Clostridium intestinale TaxID=36845 RepID=A0A7D6ZRQ2_9CLOT|nr:hypothetical protein [Clostridium intestinale]QLY78033.1 hypothetical protein HZF06_13105 [Clostridium intestinale]